MSTSKVLYGSSAQKYDNDSHRISILKSTTIHPRDMVLSMPSLVGLWEAGHGLPVSGTVSTWVGYKGGNLIQPTASKRPVIQANSLLKAGCAPYFDGTDDTMYTDSIWMPSGVKVPNSNAILTTGRVNGVYNSKLCYSSKGSPRQNWYHYVTGTYLIGIYDDTAKACNSSYSGSDAIGSPGGTERSVSVYDSPKVRIRFNGVQYTRNLSGGDPTGQNTITRLYVSGANGSYSFMNGSYGAIATFNKALSESECAIVDIYLRWLLV